MLDVYRTQVHLATIPEAFRLHPLPDVGVPKPEQWADFLLDHPDYVNGGIY